MKKGIAIGLAAITALSAAAYAGFGMGPVGAEPLHEYSEEIREALESGSYEDFVAALSEANPDRAEIITEDVFDRLVNRMQNQEEVRAALEDGDYDAFLSAIGNVNPRVAEEMTADRFNEMVKNHAIQLAVEEAVENHDYDAWAEAILELPNGEALVEIVDPDDFETLIELHEARMNSEFEDPGLLEGALGMGIGKAPHRGMGIMADESMNGRGSCLRNQEQTDTE